MKVLMFGWEFPPFFAGGVGVVCDELTKELVKRDDVSITYVMPFGPKEMEDKHLRILVANNIVAADKIKFRKIHSLLSSPYMGSEEYKKKIKGMKRNKDGSVEMMHDNTLQLYGKNLISEVYNFAERTRIIVEQEDFDVIHAHDWMTIPAALVAKQMTGKPLVLHIHNTIYDRYLGGGGEQEKEIELDGLRAADRIIAISNLVRTTLIDKYGVHPDKIEVIHHAKILSFKHNGDGEPSRIKEKDKIVLYAGRVTLQKGPEYFIEAANKVLKHYKNVRFIMAGSGEKLQSMINRVAELGISDKFMFHGFYTAKEGAKFYDMSDVFILPSVSEPFGITALESMLNKTPAIVSKQSGCSEILSNALKVDFWDVDLIANYVVSLLNHEALHNTVTNEGYNEVDKLTWEEPARRCVDVYEKVLIGRTHP